MSTLCSGQPAGSSFTDLNPIEVPTPLRASIGRCPQGRYGEECEYACHCPLENVALRKKTFQHGTYLGWNASRAVDGNVDQDGSYGSCAWAHNNDDVFKTWWNVDLGSMYDVKAIEVYFRTDDAMSQSRRAGVRVYISDSVEEAKNQGLCYIDQMSDFVFPPTHLVLRDASLACTKRRGRFVILYTDRPTQDPIRNCPTSTMYSCWANLELCEVEVYECGDGRYGQGCNKTCGQCSDPLYSCNKKTGACRTCRAGWQGEKCDAVCNAGSWGEGCQETCGHCIGTCNPQNGTCNQGCEPGYIGATCMDGGLLSDGDADANVADSDIAEDYEMDNDDYDVCPSGVYGPQCALPCANCKDGAACHHVTGRCPAGCAPGFKGDKCTDECPAGTYGETCKLSCGACHSGASCHHETGRCPAGCQNGWTGDTCQQKCKSGFYGDQCASECGFCQANDTCDHVAGVCANGCDDGWMGDKCKTPCSPGHYGHQCVTTCGACLKGDACDHVSGDCRSGCADGWREAGCKSPCPFGSYGNGCKKKCGFCRHNSTCNHVTGLCSDGCNPAYNGEYCDMHEITAVTTINNNITAAAAITLS
ncbi:multiple epidermal growth factor-like domains protein 10 [Dreissena polymorpha]|uniref:multiple epidermal growth factor-like domains protein 10 n=1 Tax=Dreissena polymorpha TaxID=45954 RepID=UPI002264C15B|nr:multiple epidermal growth factor-like domains protein 10 [Dreissena polymorpha]